ncbi:unnamed protein product [Hymenolepis diminuta]|uniref:Protein kinase domain-containing protein n=2 Tax=Hymenolepis diminuta TaxID=6216 RepID=A0A564YSR5_HYMDI|nr:unnamed protein product [Hymenolepis diminuta]
MGDFIKSAFGYFGGPSQGVKEHELVGESVEVGKAHFRIRRVIAEGGYAVVLEGYDNSQGRSFAIKRLFAADQDAVGVVMNEIDVLKRLSGHPNIMTFYGCACAGKERGKHVGNEFLIVTELCSGGQLKDFLPVPHQGKHLSADIVLQVLTQTSRAIQHMHKQSPPIIHRDLKIENILLSESFTIKLCDFGSATTETFSPSMSWSATERGRVQESLEKVTTPMYRSPEMLDLYLNYPINEALDIWAFGCIMFYLVCGFHPFEDSAKLAILNANYNLPPSDSDFEPFHNLIRQMLLVDPTQRPNINSVYGELSDLATTRNVPAFDPIIFNEDVRRKLRTRSNDGQLPVQPISPFETSTPLSQPPANHTSSAPPSRPSVGPGGGNIRTRPCPPSPANGSVSSVDSSLDTPERYSLGGGGGGVLGFLKGSAGHLIKNIKETSSKMMEAVTATIPGDLDLQYITTRMAVMSYPAESGLEAVVGSRNSMEEAQAYLDRHHPNSYAVYNLSPRSYRSSYWFGGRVSLRRFELNRAPSLASLIELCQNARLWLSQKPDNVCVIHCGDGRQLSAVFVCSLLCFCGVFSDAASAARFFASKRSSPRLTPAQLRYIDYVAKLVAVPPYIPHNKPIKLLSIVMAPIPSFNRLKNGCRPYIEIYQGDKKVFTSMTDYESLRTYEFEDRKVEFILNSLIIYGDITISIYHARSFFAGKGKASSVKICQFQFHTGFIDPAATKVTFLKSELDHLYSLSTSGAQNAGIRSGGSATSRYAESFHTVLHLSVSPTERPRQGSTLVFPWETLPPESARKPMLCFTDAYEMRLVMSPAALKAHGYSATGRLLSGQSKALPQVNRNGEAAAKQDEKPPRPASPKTAATVDTLIEGLGSAHFGENGELAPKVEKESVTEESQPKSGSEAPADTPVVSDLLNISSSSPPLKTSPTNHQPPSPASSNPLFDDFFSSSSHPPSVKPATDDWQDPWGSEPAVNLNPFDPFGTATEPPEDFQKPHSPTTPKSPSDFDPFGTRKVIRTSSSTSDLFMPPPAASASTNNAASSRPPNVHISSSSSNLTGGNCGGGGAGGNPFEEFGDFFEAAKANYRSPSPSHQEEYFTADNSKPGSTSFGFPFTASTSSARQSPFTPPAGGTPPPTKHNSPPTNAASGGSFPSTRPRVTEDAFEDLLGGFNSSGATFGSTRKNQQPRTLAEIRHQKLAQTEDPEVLKVIRWLDGKEKNVRALLCTLGTVLWEGVRWEQISMADVMTVKQVKQQYRKAARAVHPDKWMNTEHVNMAKLILIELNDAMAEFEKQECPT